MSKPPCLLWTCGYVMCRVLKLFFPLLLSCIVAFKANAQRPCVIMPNICKSPGYASIVINADNGKIIHQKNAFEVRYPASLTKMMTLFLTFDALKSKKLWLYKKLI